MNISHIDHLRDTLRDVFQDAADYHEMMADQTGEAIHLVIHEEQWRH